MTRWNTTYKTYDTGNPYGSTKFDYFQLKLLAFAPKRILLIGNLMNVSFSKKVFYSPHSRVTRKTIENIYNKHSQTYLTLYDLDVAIFAATNRSKLKNNKNVKVSKNITISIKPDCRREENH